MHNTYWAICMCSRCLASRIRYCDILTLMWIPFIQPHQSIPFIPTLLQPPQNYKNKLHFQEWNSRSGTQHPESRVQHPGWKTWDSKNKQHENPKTTSRCFDFFLNEVLKEFTSICRGERVGVYETSILISRILHPPPPPPPLHFPLPPCIFQN